MTAFRTNFWELLSDKEQKEGIRYGNIVELAKTIGTSRVTFYKYADDTLPSVDASVIQGFMDFLGLAPEELDKFLVLELDPQSGAQGVSANGQELETARTVA